MKKTINCFVPYASKQQAEATAASLKESDLVTKVFFLLQDEGAELPEGTEGIKIDSLTSSETVKKIAAAADSDYILL